MGLLLWPVANAAVGLTVTPPRPGLDDFTRVRAESVLADTDKPRSHREAREYYRLNSTINELLREVSNAGTATAVQVFATNRSATATPVHSIQGVTAVQQ